ncbi:MAG: adenylate/guanylate cyclase domain-containing protein, partial [Fusobacteriaceae bacterium]|nr:adenylate/guanylate cyclase domain-containing protein [Fusobacteriaceae bacterium]
MDIITILIFSLGVIFLFEYLIKDILIKNSISKFYENINKVQFDLINSISYIEEKKEMPYEENIDKVFEYLKLSALKRSKYNNSLFLTVFPEEQNKVVAGKRNNLNIKYNLKGDEYNLFKSKIEELISNKKNNKIVDYIDFNFQGRKYIGIAEVVKKGVKKDFIRENKELIYPILITADRNDDFFFIINKIRNIFLIALFILLGIVSYIKIKNTVIATREIKATSDSITDISNEIKNSGIVRSEIKEMETKFEETSNLDNSFVNLTKTLISVGDIISGIADKDLFKATLKNDNSLLTPHDETMAVMFLDIQGYTTIAEKHKNDIMTIINSIWDNVEDVISIKKAKINKYIGDASLIIFRDTDNKSDKPTSLNAFLSAVELLERVPDICNKLGITFNFRIGLDYGKVTYGKTGTDENFELGVIGDTVNTASRLETLNKQYHTNFLITDTAFNSAGLNCDKDLDLKELINKDIVIKCFRVDKAKPKGKKEAKEFFTVLKKNQKDQYSFIGSDKTFNVENFEYYEKLTKIYLNSIKYWQEYIKTNDKSKKIEAENNWINLVRTIGNFYYKIKFPPLENFIKSLVKIEEYEEFKSNPEIWLNKKTYNINVPSLEWIKSGIKELEK